MGVSVTDEDVHNMLFIVLCSCYRYHAGLNVIPLGCVRELAYLRVYVCIKSTYPIQKRFLCIALSMKGFLQYALCIFTFMRHIK